MPSTPRSISLVAAFISFAGIAQAHPGHDGHELTWDMQHLADHPIATVLCAALVTVAAWAVWRGGRFVQSLRASQLKRGK